MKNGLAERAATATVDALILDLLEWIGPNARPYAETLEGWRTSCPRLPVWEEANDRGFIAWREAGGTHLSVVTMGLGLQSIDSHIEYLATVAQALSLPNAH